MDSDYTKPTFPNPAPNFSEILPLDYAYQTFQDLHDDASLASFTATLRFINHATYSILSTQAAKSRRAAANATLATYPDRLPLCQHLARKLFDPETLPNERLDLVTRLTTALQEYHLALDAAKARDEANAVIAADARDRAQASSSPPQPVHDAFHVAAEFVHKYLPHPPHLLSTLNLMTGLMLSALETHQIRYLQNLALLKEDYEVKCKRSGSPDCWPDHAAAEEVEAYLDLEDRLAAAWRARGGAGVPRAVDEGDEEGDWTGDGYLRELETFWRKWMAGGLYEKRLWEEEWCYVSGRLLRVV